MEKQNPTNEKKESSDSDDDEKHKSKTGEIVRENLNLSPSEQSEIFHMLPLSHEDKLALIKIYKEKDAALKKKYKGSNDLAAGLKEVTKSQ